MCLLLFSCLLLFLAQCLHAVGYALSFFFHRSHSLSTASGYLSTQLSEVVQNLVEKDLANLPFERLYLE
jgi:hypothetical protein